MAKKQTRRSISVSRTTYERLKAFCETNNISMSQLVETQVNGFLGPSDVTGASGMATSAGVASAGIGSVAGRIDDWSDIEAARRRRHPTTIV